MVLALTGAKLEKKSNHHTKKNNIDDLQTTEKKIQNVNTNFMKQKLAEAEKKWLNNFKAEMEYENYMIEKKQNSNEPPSFKEYMHKFAISHVLDKLKSETSNVTEHFIRAADLIDPTDELLQLHIEPINSNPFYLKTNRRAWIPPSRLKKRLHIDMFSLRPRIYFLMQQSLYQARDSLIEMQVLRSKYRHTQLYKMGYLIARTDHLAQLFAGESYKAIFLCYKQWYSDPEKRWNREVVRVVPYEYYDIEERLLNHWFEIDLLRELIRTNHQRSVDAVKLNKKTWKKTWVFDT